jgi:hypothetical protein
MAVKTFLVDVWVTVKVRQYVEVDDEILPMGSEEFPEGADLLLKDEAEMKAWDETKRELAGLSTSLEIINLHTLRSEEYKS